MDTTSSRTELHDAVRAAVDAQRQDVLEARAARDAQRRKQANRTPLYVTLFASWGLLGWLWVARPASVFDARPPARTLTPVQAEAQARYALFLERSRIEAYRRSHGRLPVALGDAGPVEDGVEYVRTGWNYVLTRTINGQPLRLTGTMAADSFLGSSLEVLRDMKH